MVREPNTGGLKERSRQDCQPEEDKKGLNQLGVVEDCTYPHEKEEGIEWEG